MTINELIERAHSQAKSMGWWNEERNTGELLMLIISECGEALEAHRSGKRSDPLHLGESSWMSTTKREPDGSIFEVNDKLFAEFFKDHIKDTFEDELADIVIRIADLMGHLGYHTSMEPTDEQSFTNVGEGLLEVTDCICQYWSLEGPTHLWRAVNTVFEITNWHDIDLWRHIDLKLTFNLTRGQRHGKAY